MPTIRANGSPTSLRQAVSDSIISGNLQMRKQLIRVVFGLSVCAVMTGCTTQAWAPSNVAVRNKSEKTVKVIANFGRSADTDVLNVRNYGVCKALEDTIVQYGVFSRVVSSGNADYLLEVSETSATPQPIFAGASVTLEVEWRWSLKMVQSGKVVWQECIKSQGTGSFSSSTVGWVGDVRVAEAKKGAVRENIRVGLERISALSR
jgi:hypothetical protein